MQDRAGPPIVPDGEGTGALKILFIHQNFPAQFGSIGVYLAAQGWDVTFATARQDAMPPRGCRMLRFAAQREPSDSTHRYLQGTERAILNGQGFARTALQVATTGYRPDLIVAHSGWGSGTFARSVWPDVPLISYIEWFYSYPLIDRLGPPPVEEVPAEERSRLLVRNTPFLLDAEQSEMILCPTFFQAERFPPHYRERLTVVHDGVDCVANVPEPGKPMRLEGLDLSDADEVVTYATRSMEPHRGFPEFMRALARVQKRRPGLQAVIAGEDRVAYGSRLPEGESWKKRMLAELDLDLNRVHFTGLLARPDFRTLLQATSLHVYFTLPFVLSWSLLEAMSCGAPILSSDVAPVREVLTNGISGRLVDHGDVSAVAAAIEAALDDRPAMARMGASARQTVLQRYDSRWIYPAKAEMFRALTLRSSPERK